MFSIPNMKAILSELLMARRSTRDFWGSCFSNWMFWTTSKRISQKDQQTKKHTQTKQTKQTQANTSKHKQTNKQKQKQTKQTKPNNQQTIQKRNLVHHFSRLDISKLNNRSEPFVLPQHTTHDEREDSNNRNSLENHVQRPVVKNEETKVEVDGWSRLHRSVLSCVWI